MYHAETEGVAVSVRVAFLPDQSDAADARYAYAYSIRIENRRSDVVQLVSRHWRITDAFGLTQEVRGMGVVGEQPTLRPGEAFQYTSGAVIRAAPGVMAGTYQFRRLTDDAAFQVEIPAFALDSPFGVGRPN